MRKAHVHILAALLLFAVCLPFSVLAEDFVISSGVKIIEEEAFSEIGASGLVIPASVERIESRAFASCRSLTDVYLPEKEMYIAEDAFDPSMRLTFHVSMGSPAAEWVENWAEKHDCQIDYTSSEGMNYDYGGWSKVESLILTESVGTSNSDPYYTHRLIVHMNPGYPLPNVNSFKLQEEEDPIIVPLEQDYYVIQFHTTDSAKNCAYALNNLKPDCDYAEADYFMGDRALLTPKSSGSVASEDPMGFGLYTQYLVDHVSSLGNVTIAVIDTGVNKSGISCKYSDKSYDFVYSRGAPFEYSNSHGTEVAKQICDAFGPKLQNHLTIISYRVVRPNDDQASYLLVSKAIRQAKEDGADFINISHVFDSPYITSQNNRYLQDSISVFNKPVFAAAGNNPAMSAQSAMPAKYCISVTGAKVTDDGTQYVRAATASGANYAGFDLTSSFATAKVTAAKALLSLDPDPTHTLNGCCIKIAECGNGMPNLSKYVVNLVEKITVFGENSYTRVVGAPLYIQYSVNPSAPTDPVILAESSNEDVLKIHETTMANCFQFDAVGPGDAIITITSHDGNATPVKINVTVIQPPRSVVIGGNTEEILWKGQTRRLTATVDPEDTTDKAVEWTSSNSEIASVDKDTGVVSQTGEGTVTITAACKADRTVYAQVKVTVSSEPAVSGVTVSPAGGLYTLYLGKTAGKVQMLASVLPEGTNQSVTWSVDKQEVATVDENGLVTAAGDGEVIVTATSVVNGKTGYAVLTVKQLPVSVSITGPNMVETGKTIKLTASVLPENTRNKNVVWSSTDESVLSVSQDGTVTGVGEGSARIEVYCEAAETVSASKLISTDILPVSVAIVTPSSTIFDINGTISLSAAVSPANATNQKITWSTNDSSIATVNAATGVVTAKAAGTVNITASTHNGKTDSITLTVRQPYTLICNANDSSDDIQSRTCYSGYPIGGTLPSLTRTGYSFEGWYTSATGGSKVTTDSIFTSSSSVQIYAHWRAKTYTVTFNSNYTSGSTSTKTVTYDSTYGELPAATRTGYWLTGWFTAASGGSQITSSTKVTITSAQTLYAHWTPNVYTVTYNANGGSVSVSSKSVTYDSTYGDLATPARTGYRFDGWFTAASGGNQITSSTKVTITSAQTLYAHWTANDYTYSIVYKSSNGTALGTSSEKHTFGTTNTITPPAYAGYTTPAAQSIAWNATSKTITFTYSPASVSSATTSGTFTTSPSITYTTETSYRNRTATSVEICVKWTLTIHGKGKTTMQNAIHFWGTCGSVSIPNTKITSWDEWKGPYASGVNKTKSATSSWVTVPLTTTNQTTLSLSMELWQCNSNGTKLTGNTHKTGLALTVNIPAY